MIRFRVKSEIRAGITNKLRDNDKTRNAHIFHVGSVQPYKQATHI